MFSKSRSIVDARKSLATDITDAFVPARAASVTAALQVVELYAIIIERHHAAKLTPMQGDATIARVREACDLAHALRGKMMEVHRDMLTDRGQIAFLEDFVPTCDPDQRATAEANTAQPTATDA